MTNNINQITSHSAILNKNIPLNNRITTKPLHYDFMNM